MDSGMCSIYALENVAESGMMPREKLVKICNAYYNEQEIGITRAYNAIGVNQTIDYLIRCYNTVLPPNAEYAILEDRNQYRITLKQRYGDDVVLTLERLGDWYDIER